MASALRGFEWDVRLWVGRTELCLCCHCFFMHNMWLCCIIPYGYEGFEGWAGVRTDVCICDSVCVCGGCEWIESGLKVDQDEYWSIASEGHTVLNTHTPARKVNKSCWSYLEEVVTLSSCPSQILHIHFGPSFRLTLVKRSVRFTFSFASHLKSSAC